MKMRIVAWLPGLKKVSLAHLLSSELGMGISEAKEVVDLILELSDFSTQTPGDPGAAVALVDPVSISVPEGVDRLALKRRLEEVGLVVDDPMSA
jgi:hypothetical protein